VATDFSVMMDISVLVGFSSLAIVLACWQFSRESVHAPLFHRLGKK